MLNNLFTAIMTKVAGSAFSTNVGGRVFLDQAPDGAEFPYAVFFLVVGTPDDVFNKKGRDLLIQFSLFSASQGATEITNMYNDLHSLFDDAAFSITSNTLIWCRESNLTTMVEEITVNNAAQAVKAWHVDFEIIVRAS